MTRTFLRTWCGLAIVAMLSVPASAQMPGAPPAALPSDPLMRFGPLALQPRISLTNLGLDTNVFNQSDTPTRDVTGTLVPSVDSSLRIGRSLTTATTSAELVYFRKAGSQRSVTLSQEGRFALALARLTPYVSGGRVHSHLRPNLEIDERFEQRKETAGVGVLVRVSGRTTIAVGRDEERLRYGGTAAVAVAAVLDRRVTSTNVALRVDLTPLTTLVIRTDTQRDRFDRSAVRDADSHAVLGGFDLKPFALISGTARVGYRRVNALSPLMSDFAGVVASVNVAYMVRESMRITLVSGRDLEYSIESQQPYYVSTGATVTVRQAIGRRWDVMGRLGRSALQYRALRLPEVADTLPPRRDRHLVYGAGLGLLVGSSMRVGAELGVERRWSPVASRRFEGMKAGGTLTYGY